MVMEKDITVNSKMENTMVKEYMFWGKKGTYGGHERNQYKGSILDGNRKVLEL